MKTGKRKKGPAIEPLDTVNESDGSSPTINGTAANGTATNGTATNGTLSWLNTAHLQCTMPSESSENVLLLVQGNDAFQRRQRNTQTTDAPMCMQATLRRDRQLVCDA